MEIIERMSKRSAWLLGVGVLVFMGLLVACGSNYNSTSDGLVLVGSQGSGLLETFSFSLASGHIAAISNPPVDTANQTCVLNGLPSSIVLDPARTYAYTIIMANSTCGTSSATGIQTFKVNSNGTISAVGSLAPFKKATAQVCQNGSQFISETMPVNPVTMVMDSAGKYLFFANALTTDASGRAVPGSISVFAVGSGGSLTEVPNSPFTVPPSCLTAANFSAVAITPTVFPGSGINGVSSAVCSQVGNTPPSAEYLYAADQSNNNAVWEFAVNSSSGALSPTGTNTSPQSVAAGAVPSGVSVDPCARFVYVSNKQSNTISAYSICNGFPTQSPACTARDWSLLPVTGSPFSLTGGANGPGPLLVDPFGKYVYVLDTLSNQVSPFTISPVSGSLTAGAVVVTGNEPASIAIRGDDSWLFVTNFTSATLSQFTITPATGVLSSLPAVTTDNYPSGLAVK
jgi:Lactonase, 7-bladed beta-propeller